MKDSIQEGRIEEIVAGEEASSLFIQLVEFFFFWGKCAWLAGEVIEGGEDLQRRRCSSREGFCLNEARGLGRSCRKRGRKVKKNKKEQSPLMVEMQQF